MVPYDKFPTLISPLKVSKNECLLFGVGIGNELSARITCLLSNAVVVVVCVELVRAAVVVVVVLSLELVEIGPT